MKLNRRKLMKWSAPVTSMIVLPLHAQSSQVFTNFERIFDTAGEYEITLPIAGELQNEFDLRNLSLSTMQGNKPLKVTIEIQGGAGGGAGGDSNNNGGSGSLGLIFDSVYFADYGENIQINVGNGGAGGEINEIGLAGGESSFLSLTDGSTGFTVAGGGGGATQSNDGANSTVGDNGSINGGIAPYGNSVNGMGGQGGNVNEKGQNGKDGFVRILIEVI